MINERERRERCQLTIEYTGHTYLTLIASTSQHFLDKGYVRNLIGSPGFWNSFAVRSRRFPALTVFPRFPLDAQGQRLIMSRVAVRC